MEGKQQGAQNVFFSGVLLLTLSTVLVKVIGFIYKIPMLSYLGSEGMGYFHSAYEIYAMFCIIATAGLPVSLSVLISGAAERGEYARLERIYSQALRIFLSIGLIGCGVMWIFAGTFCKWIQSEHAYACILAIAPTVFFVCLSSAIRGYFQGFQRMLPTAVSQILESLGKLVFGVLFASVALSRGQSTEMVAAAAGWGLSLGTALSALYLVIAKKRYCSKMRRENAKPISLCEEEGQGSVHTLLSLSLPMTLGAALGGVTKLIDMAMILRGLQHIGYTEAGANEAYGAYATLALSVFSLLPTLLNSVALPLVPGLSAAIAAKDVERQRKMVEASYRLTAFFAIPASLGVTAYAKEILSLIFRNQQESVEIAAPLLSVLGISVFLSSMITATNSVLHAHRIVKRPMLALGVGLAIKIAVGYFLIGDPRFGILGAAISSVCCNLVVVLLNVILTLGVTGGVSVKRIFLLPLLNAALSIGSVFLGYRYLQIKYVLNERVFLAAVALSVVLYFLLSLFSGGIRMSDLCAFPFCKRLYDGFIRLKKTLFKENQQKTEK